MTPEMLAVSRATASERGVANVSIVDGDLERLPLPCQSVDVVISNCVINLTDDKRRALTETYRVLAPGGRLAILDTAFETDPGEAARTDAESWGCCVGGALVRDDYQSLLEEIGFDDVNIEQNGATCGEGELTVGSVKVTARKPGTHERPGVRPAVEADRAWVDALLAELPRDGLRIEDAFVALEDEQVVGVIALERFGKAALVRSVATAREGEGIGSRLVVAALEAARWSGAEEAYVLALPRLQQFWEDQGFTPVSRERARAACRSAEFEAARCAEAVALRLGFEDLGPLSTRKELPTFQSGSCC
jgi:N-acetylglutamate synthase-like GNAT family acetyltransferase